MSLSTLHILICLCLFLDYFNYQKRDLKTFFPSKKIPTWVKHSRKHLTKHIPNKTHREFLLSIVTGEKRRFKRTREFSSLKKTQLLHLLTPSGIHLSAILCPFFLLLRQKISQWIILAITGFLLVSQPHLGAAQRVLSLKIFIKMGFPIKICFYLVFACLLPFQSTLSWLYSFLFIGIILLHKPSGFLSFFYNLFLGQWMTLIFSQDSYYPLSFFIGPLLTVYFSSIFPLLCLFFLIPQGYFLVKPLVNFAFFITSQIDSIPSFLNPHFINFFFFLSLKEMLHIRSRKKH